jgi:hypothetical protein
MSGSDAYLIAREFDSLSQTDGDGKAVVVAQCNSFINILDNKK